MEPFAKLPRNRIFAGRGKGTGPSRDTCSVPQWPQKAQNGNRQVSNLVQGSRATERGSPSEAERPQKARKHQETEFESHFVLFVVEPFAIFAGQRKLFGDKSGDRPLAGQVRSLSNHGDPILNFANGLAACTRRVEPTVSLSNLHRRW